MTDSKGRTFAERFEELLAERAEALGLRVEHLITTDSPRPERWDFLIGERRLKRTWTARTAWGWLDEYEASSRPKPEPKLKHETIDGRPALVAYLTELGGEMLEPEDDRVHLVIVRFVDTGEVAYFYPKPQVEDPDADA